MKTYVDWTTFSAEDLKQISKEIQEELETREEIEKAKDWQQVTEVIKNYTNKHGNIRVEINPNAITCIGKYIDLNNVGIIKY